MNNLFLEEFFPADMYEEFEYFTMYLGSFSSKTCYCLHDFMHLKLYFKSNDLTMPISRKMITGIQNFELI